MQIQNIKYFHEIIPDAFKLNEESYFLEGPHSHVKDFGFTIEILREFIKGFRKLHFVVLALVCLALQDLKRIIRIIN